MVKILAYCREKIQSCFYLGDVETGRLIFFPYPGELYPIPDHVELHCIPDSLQVVFS